MPTENNVLYLSDTVITQENKCPEGSSSITIVLDQPQKNCCSIKCDQKETCNPRNFTRKIISPCWAMYIHSKSLRVQHTNNSGT